MRIVSQVCVPVTNALTSKPARIISGVAGAGIFAWGCYRAYILVDNPWFFAVITVSSGILCTHAVWGVVAGDSHNRLSPERISLAGTVISSDTKAQRVYGTTNTSEDGELPVTF